MCLLQNCVSKAEQKDQSNHPTFIKTVIKKSQNRLQFELTFNNHLYLNAVANNIQSTNLPPSVSTTFSTLGLRVYLQVFDSAAQVASQKNLPENIDRYLKGHNGIKKRKVSPFATQAIAQFTYHGQKPQCRTSSFGAMQIIRSNESKYASIVLEFT